MGSRDNIARFVSWCRAGITSLYKILTVLLDSHQGIRLLGVSIRVKWIWASNSQLESDSLTKSRLWQIWSTTVSREGNDEQ